MNILRKQKSLEWEHSYNDFTRGNLWDSKFGKKAKTVPPLGSNMRPIAFGLDAQPIILIYSFVVSYFN